jgi:hypothetical protein
MITEPPDGRRRPLQDFETLYIGGAEPAVVHRPFGHDGAKIKPIRVTSTRDCEENLTITMARIVSGTGPMEQARGLNDE